MATFSRNLYYFYHKGFSVFSPEPPANIIYTDSVLYVKEPKPSRLENTERVFLISSIMNKLDVPLNGAQVSVMISICSVWLQM